jgi:hypothetical protein
MEGSLLRALSWRAFLTWGLITFFVFAGLLNVFAPAPLREDYLRWGYPSWFHYTTGAVEFLSALLQGRRATSKAGVVLGALVMGVAVLTLLIYHEGLHAAFPFLIFVALAARFMPEMQRSQQTSI